MSRGWSVVLAGFGVNLALGILYTWSVISGAIPETWGWTEQQKSWPFAVCCLVFSLMMVPAGRLQDKISPRLVATLGGMLVGLGMILASGYLGSAANEGWNLPPYYLEMVIGFGLLAGTGIGCGYASATPPAVKWFPAAKTGMIAGIVVSGFGLASVYAAPLTNWLVKLAGRCAAGDVDSRHRVPDRRRGAGAGTSHATGRLCPARDQASRSRTRSPRRWTSKQQRCFARFSSICCGSCMRAAPAPV